MMILRYPLMAGLVLLFGVLCSAFPLQPLFGVPSARSRMRPGLK